MLKKIENQINEFTNGIKEEKGCDELIAYMNSSYVSSIKLLMFASSSFSLYARLLLFFIIANGGLLMFTAIGALPLDFRPFLVVTFILVSMMIFYTSHFKKRLILSINDAKNSMKSQK